MKKIIIKNKFKKKIFRYPKNLKKLYFNNGRKIISEDLNTFAKKFNIHNVIGLHYSDFKLIKKGTSLLTHFNIQYTNHKPGKNYLIIKIHKQGYFDGKVFIPRILSTKNFIFAKCLSAKNHINYNDLKDNVFKYSLRNIKNIFTLKRAIKRRYKKSFANLTNAEKLSLGVAITKLKIVKSNFGTSTLVSEKN